MSYTKRLVLAQLTACDLLQVHLVGTVDEVERARVRPHLRQRPVVSDACTAERLDRTVDHRGREVGGHDLDRADLEARALLADGVDQPGCFEREEARLLDVDARLRDAL